MPGSGKLAHLLEHLPDFSNRASMLKQPLWNSENVLNIATQDAHEFRERLQDGCVVVHQEDDVPFASGSRRGGWNRKGIFRAFRRGGKAAVIRLTRGGRPRIIRSLDTC